MTREEVKSCIGTIELLRRLAFNVHGVMDVIDAQNCDKIIALLSQEPCEDAVSRQAVFDAHEKVAELFPWRVPGKYDTYDRYNEAWHDAIGRAEMEIEGLPPVNPQPKMGRWVIVEDRTDWFDATYECSCCKREIIVPYDARNEVYKDYPYCHCGAKMVDSQERSGEE